MFQVVLKDGREVDAVTLVGRLFHARATVTRNGFFRETNVVIFNYKLLYWFTYFTH